MSANGVVHVECPECQEHVPVTFTVEVRGVDATGDLRVEAVPEMADVWAHAWSHDE